MTQRMQLDRALGVAEQIHKAYTKFGRQASINESHATLVETISALHEYITCAQDIGKEELTKANRRYAALNARYQKLAKKEGIAPEAVTDDQE